MNPGPDRRLGAMGKHRHRQLRPHRFRTPQGRQVDAEQLGVLLEGRRLLQDESNVGPLDVLERGDGRALPVPGGWTAAMVPDRRSHGNLSWRARSAERSSAGSNANAAPTPDGVAAPTYVGRERPK